MSERQHGVRIHAQLAHTSAEVSKCDGSLRSRSCLANAACIWMGPVRISRSLPLGLALYSAVPVRRGFPDGRQWQPRCTSRLCPRTSISPLPSSAARQTTQPAPPYLGSLAAGSPGLSCRLGTRCTEHHKEDPNPEPSRCSRSLTISTTLLLLLFCEATSPQTLQSPPQVR